MRTGVVLAASLLLLSGCEKKRYHWTDVPYCEVAKGAPGSSFSQHLRLLHVGGDEKGVSSSSGMRPARDVMSNDSYIVAVVACSNSDLLISTADLDRVAAELRARQIYRVCTGQRVVLPAVEIEATKTTHKGFHGALPFPKIDPKELTCRAGKLAYGDSL